MLNENRVLDYIKKELGFPYVHLELTDEAIMEHTKQFTIREFSYYIPELAWLGVDTSLPANKVPGKANEWYISDPQGREILNVTDIYFSLGNLILHGHPPLGPLTHGELREWALSVATSMDVKMFSSFDYTFQFKHPNVVRISPLQGGEKFVTIEYERMQSDDFSGIPNEQQLLFCDFALANIMIVLGRIRKKYSGGTLRTPFGEIPIEMDVLEEGKEKKREVIEKLNMGPLLNVIVDFG
jgi:hypothetical protein